MARHRAKNESAKDGRGDYAEMPPIAALQPAVACLWTFEGPTHGDVQRVVPDARCELIFHAGTPYAQRNAAGAFVRQPRLLFAGQLTRPLHLRGQGVVRVLAVRFKPAGAFGYMGKALDAFNDRCVPLGEVIGQAETQKLLAALGSANPARHADLLQSHVAARMAALALPVDATVQNAVDALLAGQQLTRVLENLPVSPRTLQRRFRKIVGISPQMLAAILRFRRVFAAMEKGESWTDAAQRAGFFDHPQMAREFRRFLGCTPSTFMAEVSGLASGLAGL